jgi:hypothetical protein
LKLKDLLLFILLSSLVIPVNFTTGKQSTTYLYTLSYSFENRGTKTLTIAEEDLMVPRFMNTTHQKVYIEEKTHSYTIKSDIDGNQALLIDLDRELQSGEDDGFSLTYKIESSAITKPSFNLNDAEGEENIPNELVLEYTSPSDTFMSEDNEIQNISRTLVNDEDSVLEKTLSLIEYVMKETDYTHFEYPLYPNQTLTTGEGDCDDQAILLISMLRSIGIPAYLQVGIIIHPSINDSSTSWEGHLTNTQEGVGWHGWAMVYIPPWGWIPVDLTMNKSDDAMEILKKAPEYESNVIPAINVSEQSYITETLVTMERIMDSDLYVTLNDKADQINKASKQNWLIIVLGGSTAAAIALMFYFKD